MKEVLEKFFGVYNGPWWFEGFSSFLGSISGAIIGAVVALIVVRIQLNTQRKRDKEKEETLFADQRHFIFNAIRSLEKTLVKYRQDLDLFILIFPEKEDRYIKKPSFFTKNVKRITKFSEQDALRAFINNEENINQRNDISDKTFELFEILDYFEDIENNYQFVFRQFDNQFNPSYTELSNKSSEFQYYIRELLQTQLSGQEIFQLSENQGEERVSAIINPLIKILDEYNKADIAFFKKVYDLLIDKSNLHLKTFNINTEPAIDKMYSILGIMESNYINCIRLQGKFKEDCYIKPLARINEEEKRLKNIINYLKSPNH